MRRLLLSLAVCGLLAGATYLAFAQRPGQPGRPGPNAPPPRPDPERFVEHALQFDADRDGKLNRDELRKFAEDFARGPGARPGSVPAAASAGPAKHFVDIREQDGFRVIRSNGIPDHEPGQFPNRGNPNRISAQQYEFRMPLTPRAADRPSPARIFGVALNGVPFDPGTAELWNGDPAWRYDALSGQINLGLDASNAHVQPTGAYHYHGLPHALIRLRGRPDDMVLVGYAGDGFPIYNQWGPTDPLDLRSPLKKLRSSYQLKRGSRPAGRDGPGGAYDGTFNQDFEYVAGSGDLDDCHGRVGVTKEYPAGTYYYAITEQFPFIGRQFRGTPDPSFRTGPGGPPPGGRPRPPDR